MSVETVLQAVETYRTEAPQHLRMRDLFNGKHPAQFASPKFRRDHGWLLEAAVENLCPAVVYAYVDRLNVESWGIAPDQAAKHGLDRLARLVHTEAHVTGNAFAITWNRPGTNDPMAVFHRADQVIPFVDPEQPDRLAALAKIWLDPDGFSRINLYRHDHVARWKGKQRSYTVNPADRSTLIPLPDAAAGWEPFNTDTVPHEEGHDFGTVPAVWWKRDAPSQYEPGVSVLRDVASPQLRLNKALADLMVASERISKPIRYALGMNPEQLMPKLNPETGKVEPPTLPFDDSRHNIMALSAQGPAGQFQDPASDKILALKQDLEAEISAVSGLPAFYLSRTSGDVPSGESLRVVSMRMTAGVNAFQRDATAPWNGQLELFGIEKPAIKWADAMPMDESERVQIGMQKQTIGYSLEDVVAGIGDHDPDGIVSRAREDAAKQATAAGRAFREGQTRY